MIKNKVNIAKSFQERGLFIIIIYFFFNLDCEERTKRCQDVLLMTTGNCFMLHSCHVLDEQRLVIAVE